jgi:DNA primase
MGGRIPDELIERIRTHFDIVDIVQQYVQLKKSGRNWFGLCPFHSEKTPSFSVAPDKQIFHCFGCGAGGDLIKFVMDIEQLTFVEALRRLAEQAGIEVPELSGPEDGEDSEFRQMREALELAARLYHHLLVHTEHGDPARRYLAKRRIVPDSVETFLLGYAPSSSQFLLSFMKKRGFSEEILEKAGLIVAREGRRKEYFDRFRDRLMFPIHDGRGRVVGFGGRIIGEGQPKYMNSPETPLFRKGNHLFNLHRARSHMRSQNQAVVFEGYMDVIAAWQAGIYNGIATLGTSLTDDHARVIRRFAESVILCYDADTGGQSGTLRGMEILANRDLTVKVAQMPVGMDPDEYIRVRGGEAFRTQILGGALSLTSFKLESLKKNHDLKDEAGRMRYLSEALDVIAALPLVIEQDHYCRRLAEEFHLSLDAVKEELRRRKLEKKRQGGRDKVGAVWNNGYREVGNHMFGTRSVSLVEKSEMFLIAHMMRSRAVTEWVKEHLGAEFHTELYAALAAYLYAYYEQGNPEDPGRFVSGLSDATLGSAASRCAMLEVPNDVPVEALQDYVRHIRNASLVREIEEKKKQMEQLARANEPVKAAQLSQEIARLQQQLRRTGG